MPHRVTTFFRTSSNSLETQVSNLKKATTAVRRGSSPNSSGRASRSSERTFSYASSLDSDADEAQRTTMTTAPQTARSVAPTDKHHEHHRLSFPGLHFGRSSKEVIANPHASLDWKIESPPAVLYGDAENSSGALVSGQLFVKVKEDGFQVGEVKAKLQVHVTQKRPFTIHCNECTNQYTELQKWSFIQAPLTLTKGEHAFPFSVLLGGHLPASLDGPLVSIAYEFRAEITPKPGFGVPIKLEKVLDVKRSLPTPEVPHHSVRVFPPTNIRASIHYPQIFHPIGQNTLSLRLDGIAKVNTSVKTVEYWKLKKLTWKLEEVCKTIAPACEKHTPKDPKDGQQQVKKGIQRTETRVIGEKTMFSGWKSNYGTADESWVELELEYGIGRHSKYSCDTKARDGSEVTHQLMVEMVVSHEWAPVGKPALIAQTGIGRILRMHFGSVLTERAGIGISWDNEAPPIYQDVPPSPPAYSEEIGECSISDIEPLDDADGSTDGMSTPSP